MLSHGDIFFSRIGIAVGRLFSGPQALALVPAAVLAGYWIGGEQVLIAMAIGFPLVLAASRMTDKFRQSRRPDADEDDPTSMARLVRHLDDLLRQAKRKSLKCGCIMVELDDYDSITDRYGQAAGEHVINRSRDRLKSSLRGRDKVYHITGGQFAVALAPVRQLDMNAGLQLSERLQRTVEEPISLDATTIYVSASVGISLNSQVENCSAKALGRAADLALRDARRHAPSAIRIFTPDMKLHEPPHHAMTDDLIAALENGQIQPWFQPQISADSGHITGFEALARWIHPDRGLIAPSEFLPVLEEAGKMERLGEVMLYHSLHALKAWDAASLSIPRVGVNFSPDELRNPKLVQKIEWELDRFDLTPDRLMVEVLETVVATSPDDTVSRNINGLAALGCSVDLDDFGTGHASISSIRRFAIGRLKIDRSFIMKVDQDAEQQRMVSAILLMAEQLELDTLAEGVETAGEHAMLAQLGCKHIQGFGISRPLPFDKTIAWAEAHNEKLGPPPMIGRKIG